MLEDTGDATRSSEYSPGHHGFGCFILTHVLPAAGH